MLGTRGGGSSAGPPPVEFSVARYEFAVPVMAEVYVTRLMDRDEFSPALRPPRDEGRNPRKPSLTLAESSHSHPERHLELWPRNYQAEAFFPGSRSRVEGDKCTGLDRAPNATGLGLGHRKAAGLGPRPDRSQPPSGHKFRNPFPPGKWTRSFSRHGR
jgi:hypothetical protein